MVFAQNSLKSTLEQNLSPIELSGECQGCDQLANTGFVLNINSQPYFLRYFMNFLVIFNYNAYWLIFK
jgi:hypothetical protein